MNRRRFLSYTASAAASLALPTEARFTLEQGLWNKCRQPLPDELKRHPAIAGLAGAFDATQVWDCHVHIFGNGKSGGGIWLNPSFAKPLNPINAARKAMFMSGGCIGADDAGADARMISELAARVRELPKGAKAMVLAFDAAYREDGERADDWTMFNVPDAYAAKVARAQPDVFEWLASIHPYRKDAIAALNWAKQNGARGVKWLPPAMGIDLRHEKCLAFYAQLARLNMPLLTHVGEEKAVPGAGRYDLSNPLLLRVPLDAGVRVIAAHCATAGESDDLDAPERTREKVSDFELFTRLMGEARYQGKLFGDISAVSLISRADALGTIVSRGDWHGRLLNGSDYPLPGVMPLISVKKMASEGLLDEGLVDVLAKVREHNALLFDLALKVALRKDGKRLAASVFETRRFFTSSAL
jgi:uncharacterized protein